MAVGYAVTLMRTVYYYFALVFHLIKFLVFNFLGISVFLHTQSLWKSACITFKHRMARKSLEKNLKGQSVLWFMRIQFSGFTDNVFVMKTLIRDSCFTVTVALLGSIGSVDHFLYCRATPVYSEKISLELPGGFIFKT